jgi:hypothetical protein
MSKIQLNSNDLRLFDNNSHISFWLLIVDYFQTAF